MTISLSELAGRPVLDISTAKTVAYVGSAIIDPSRSSVSALHLAKSVGADVLPWESIKAIGPDAITIDTVDQLRAPVGRSEQRAIEASLNPIGIRALTNQGRELGAVNDMLVDERTGNIEQIVTTGDPLDGGTIAGIGNYALIVQADAPLS